MKRLSLIITFFSALFPAIAQKTSPYEARLYVNSEGDTLPYRILAPEGYMESGESYPLLFFLHGAGERGNDNEAQLVHGASVFAKKMKQYPAIIVFPQCAADGYWGEIERDESGFTYPFYEKANPNLQLAMGLLDRLIATQPIDTNRLYLGGLSMGGFGTFELLARRPNTFAAAFPICGGGMPLLAPLYASNTPVWIFHGAKDQVVPVQESRDIYQALKNAGAKVKYTEYRRAKHNSWEKAFAERDLYSWLFSQRKSD